jgi:CRP-like cAMP-binding protein
VLLDELRQSLLFQGIDSPLLEEIETHSRMVEFLENEVIFRESRPADTLYLIKSGLIALQVSAPTLGTRIIQTISSDDIVGWSWLFPPYRWHFDALALEPVKAIAIDGKWLREKMNQDTDFGYLLMGRVAGMVIQRLQATRLQLLDIYAQSA